MKIRRLPFLILSLAFALPSLSAEPPKPTGADGFTTPQFAQFERSIGVSLDPAAGVGAAETKINTAVSVVRVDARKAKDVDSAVRWLRTELAANESGAADIQKQIFVVGPGHDDYFLSPDAAQTIGAQLGWASAEAHAYKGLEGVPPEFSEAVSAAQQLESGSVIFQGLVTRESLSQRNKPSTAQLPTKMSDWAFILFRVAVNGSVVAKVAMLTPGVSVVQAAEIGATAGFMSGALQAFHPQVMKWFGQKGYLRPSDFKSAGFIESFYIKDFLSEFVFLSVVEAVEVINHMHGQFSMTPLTLALKTPLAEGTMLATLAKATQLYGEQARRGQLLLPEGFGDLLAKISSGPLGKVVHPALRVLDKAAGGPVLQASAVNVNQLALTQDAVRLLSKMGGVGFSAALTGLTVLGINHFAGTDLALMTIGAAGGLAYAGVSGAKLWPPQATIRQVGQKTLSSVNACVAASLKRIVKGP